MNVLLFDDMINIKVFDLNLRKVDKRSYKKVDNYYTGYIAIKKKSMIMKIFPV